MVSEETSGARKIYCWWRRIRLESTSTNWIDMSMWSNGLQLRVLKELADAAARPHFIVSEQLQWLREVLEDWKRVKREVDGENSPVKCFQIHERRKLLGEVNVDLQRGDHI